MFDKLKKLFGKKKKGQPSGKRSSGEPAREMRSHAGKFGAPKDAGK